MGEGLGGGVTWEGPRGRGVETCKLCFFSSLLCYAPMPEPCPIMLNKNAYYALKIGKKINK